MASAFGHALVGYTLSKVIDRKKSKLLIALAVGSAILPDLDVLSFNFGIPYTHWLGHRGVTHSIFFAILWAGFCALIFGKSRRLLFFTVIFLSTLSHALLDALTSGGEGVGFFIPFENSRHFFESRPIKVSPIGVSRFFSEWGWKVICSEAIWIGLPCMSILIFEKIMENIRIRHSSKNEIT